MGGGGGGYKQTQAYPIIPLSDDFNVPNLAGQFLYDLLENYCGNQVKEDC
jgi:hypothetical protein